MKLPISIRGPGFDHIASAIIPIRTIRSTIRDHWLWYEQGIFNHIKDGNAKHENTD